MSEIHIIINMECWQEIPIKSNPTQPKDSDKTPQNKEDQPRKTTPKEITQKKKKDRKLKVFS